MFLLLKKCLHNLNMYSEFTNNFLEAKEIQVILKFTKQNHTSRHLNSKLRGLGHRLIVKRIDTTRQINFQ